MMRNFFEMFLPARRAPEFWHSQGHKRHSQLGEAAVHVRFAPIPDVLMRSSRTCQKLTHAMQQKKRERQPFSSRFSSLKKRQSVPSAMILLGADLIIAASCNRSEKNRIVSSGL